MASRYEVEVTVGSARDLKNVNWRNGDLMPYAVLWIDPASKSSTRVAVDGDVNPTWDEKLVIPLPPSARIEDAVLFLDVVHANASEGVKPLVGSARLPLRDVVDEVGIGGRASRSLRLKRPSGRPQGRLDARIAVREAARYYDPYAAPPPQPYGQPARSREYGGGYGDYGQPYGAQPYVAPPPAGYPYSARPLPAGYAPYGSAPTAAYGAPPPAAAYGAPPPASAYGAPPPASAYAAPPPASAYGAPPPPAYGDMQGPAAYGGGAALGADVAAGEEKKKNKMGTGTKLAIGAAAGVLGGLALAEGASFLENKFEDRVAEKVEERLDDEDSYGGGYDDDY